MSTPPATREPTLAELPEEAFAQRYDCDRFTATVIANRLRYVVGHMSTGLLHRAFSPIISYYYDFATAISGPPEQGYPMAATNNGLLVFLGTVGDAVRNVMGEYGPERLKPGDLLVCNDPWRGGNHVNDLMLTRPVFHQRELAGFVTIRAHQLDMGGTVPSGFGAGKRNVYETGLVLGPRLLYRDEEPVRETFSLIFDNARMGEMLLPDLETIHQCCRLGERLVDETVGRYGREAYLGALRYCCDSSAETMSRALEELPDGDFVGASGLDCDAAGADETYGVQVRIAKRGGRVEVDLSGSSRQARTCINATAWDSKTAIGIGLKMLVDPASPVSSGTFLPLDVVVPHGTITSALPPDGAVFFYWEVESALLSAMLVALREMLGADAFGGDSGSSDAHNANGLHPDGTPWLTMAECGGEFGAWGANREGDGEGYASPYLLNMMSPATEAIEQRVPAMILRKQYAIDTAGPGENRGGPGVLKDVLFRSDGEHYTMPLRFKSPSGVGVNGGGDGHPGAVWLFDAQTTDGIGQRGELVGIEPPDYAAADAVAGLIDPSTNLPDPDGEFAYFGRVPAWQTAPGAMFRYLTNGGGGWGDPQRRDPERVKRDVRDGYVSIEQAAAVFGVVVEGDPERWPERLTVDEEATRRRRAEMGSGSG